MLPALFCQRDSLLFLHSVRVTMFYIFHVTPIPPFLSFATCHCHFLRLSTILPFGVEQSGLFLLQNVPRKSTILPSKHRLPSSVLMTHILEASRVNSSHSLTFLISNQIIPPLWLSLCAFDRFVSSIRTFITNVFCCSDWTSFLSIGLVRRRAPPDRTRNIGTVLRRRPWNQFGWPHPRKTEDSTPSRTYQLS